MVASHGTQILPSLEPRHLELWNLGSACSQNRPPKSVEPCLTAVFSGYAERAEGRTCGLCNPSSPPPHGAASAGDNSESQPFLVTLTGVGGATGDRVQESHSTSTRSSRGTSGVMEDKNGGIDFPGSEKWARGASGVSDVGRRKGEITEMMDRGAGCRAGGPEATESRRWGNSVDVNLNFRIAVLSWLLEDGSQSC